MNRIIILGNGFDLAHDLKTSYCNFIDNFWENMTKDFNNRISGKLFENDFLSINAKFHNNIEGHHKYDSFKTWLFDKATKIDFKNHFLEIISENLSFKNWVDIEEEYYQQIKNIVHGKSQYYKDDIRKTPTAKMAIVKLNRDFEDIKQELEKYLIGEVEKNKASEIEGTYNLFYDGLKLKDIASSKEDLLIEYILEMLYSTENNKYYEDLHDKIFKGTKEMYGVAEKEHITDYLKKYFFNDNKDELEKKEYVRPIYPLKTLVLNFNYTKIESKYFKRTHYTSFQIIHIHGELNNENNPIIFGYGDELADEYKEIEKLKDKEYYKNIKSIKYLKTDKYKRLLSFADSDYFHIYIFGHSCGNSDRTLLNTLFEHENCVSIKPFFHEKNDENGKTDNYEDIVINLSRNFNKKAMFREKVVNRTYCEPLPQIKK